MSKQIERVEIPEAEKTPLKEQTFTISDFALEEGVTLIIGGADIVRHRDLKGESPVAYLYYPKDWDKAKNTAKDNAVPVTAYLKPMLKTLRNFRQEVVQLSGSFNSDIRAMNGHTIGEVLDFVNSKKGVAVRTTFLSYLASTRKGEVWECHRNGYDYIV